MQFFYFLASFLLIFRLRKVLKFSPQYPKWRQQLSYSPWIVMGIFILTQRLPDDVTGLLGSLILLGILYYISKEPDFKSFGFYVQAHYPLVGVGILTSLTELIAPNFYDKYDTYFMFAILAAFAWIYARWVNSKKQQQELQMAAMRNNELDRLVGERTAELTKQKNELQETVKLLQATQAQLIQQEKLASLGELTAGIAHEIQNPLNFVKNFSEVSMELIDEMEEELNNGDKEEAIAIAGDLKQNLEKIIHHGNRADGIVKGMLQHSRASSDVKEDTNINTLADEYLRLAYHGLRAKDKSFNADLDTHYAPDLPLINIVPQDVGRVLLNLFTNAFYAIHKKKAAAGPDYKPTVSLTTSQADNNVIVVVKDNGTGIPDAIKDKIMQPFFTTKPTGEGTGLGLSLSYDIIVKGHGGKINIDSKEGEGSEFTIQLPLKA
ncbi:histidine kinase [Mucilaginibacter mali]|uniref:histidine kinase n=1 Tax=Mucilaginibacter mali TaxID=2740462 RepID=A0A7D4Q040_9SPHI|nr:ATP-binding protein [Mucilaginibacter mali]QKJ29466.1 histidine kinase [Mucilaginibacter mali]